MLHSFHLPLFRRDPRAGRTFRSIRGAIRRIRPIRFIRTPSVVVGGPRPSIYTQFAGIDGKGRERLPPMYRMHRIAFDKGRAPPAAREESNEAASRGA
jgi:hypothetical protein